MADPFLEQWATQKAAELKPQAAPSNDSAFLDSWASDLVRDRDARLRATLGEAVMVKPEEAAKDKTLANATGLPVETIGRNRELIEKQQRIRETYDLMAQSPSLREQMMDPEFAKLAHKDTPTLSTMEHTLNVIGGTAGRVLAGATVEVGATIFDLSAVVNDYLAAGSNLVGLNSLSQYAAGGAAQNRAQAKRARDSVDFFLPAATNSTEAGLYSGAQSAGFNLATLPAAIEAAIVKGPQMAANVMGAIAAIATGSRSFNQAREAGMGVGAATTYAAPSAMAEFLFERWSGGKMFDGIAARSPFLKMLFNNATREVIGEEATTLVQNFNEWVRLNPEKTVREFIAEQPEAMYQTMIAALVGSGIQTGAVKGLQKIADRYNASLVNTEEIQHLQNMLKMAAGTELLQVSPQTLGQFVQFAAQNTPNAPTSVWIDGRILADTLAQSGLTQEELAQAMPSVLPQLADAMAANSPVEIPIGELTAAVAGKPLEKALLDDLRTKPDGLSMNESKAEQEQAQQFIQQEAERIIGQAANQVTANAQQESVRQIVKAELDAAGRFSSDVNDKGARLVSQFYTVMAERLKTTPDKLYNEVVQHKVRSEGQGALEQMLRDRIGLDFRDVVKRTPELQTAIGQLMAGEITREQFDAAVNQYKPVKPYTSVPEPASKDQARSALRTTNSEKPGMPTKDTYYGVPSATLKEGDQVGLRLDIPSYSKTGTWVVTVHGPRKSMAAGGAGARIGYESAAAATDVQFGISEKGAVGIAGGKEKNTIATMEGKWKPVTPEEAAAQAEAALNDPSWVQVGMDPERHSYFYDRATMQPVVAAQEVIQIGPLVLAKNPTYAPKSDFLFQAANSLVPALDLIVSPATLEALQQELRNYHPAAEGQISPEERVEAETKLIPLLNLAEAAKPQFDALVSLIATQMNGSPMLAPLKGMKRAAEKLVRENNGDVTQMRDMLRATVVVRSVDDVARAAEAIRSNFEVTRVKDRYASPTPSGYRDVLINVRMPNGVEAEIQVNVPAMMAAKDSAHKLYEMQRVLDYDDPRGRELEALQSRVYSEAFSFAQNAKSSAVASEPLANQGALGNGLAGASANTSEPSANLSTGTPSTSYSSAPLGTSNIGTSYAQIIAGDMLNQSMSTRIPWATPKDKSVVVENPLASQIVVGLDAVLRNPKLSEKFSEKFAGYLSMRESTAATVPEQLEDYINQMVDNLLWLHDAMPEENRNRSKLWYDGARVIVDLLDERFQGRYSPMQIAAVMAVMSPQMDWFTNVTLGERILDVWDTQQNFRWSPAMEDAAGKVEGFKRYQADLEQIRGKTLAELDSDFLQALWLVAYDRAYNTTDYRIVTPEGDFTELDVTAKGAPSKSSWANGFGPIEKAIAVLKDGSVENVSAQLGDQHKVRNFYNNIFAPTAPDGSVTIDTHAVAAALLMPLSGSSQPVADNFGAAGTDSLTGVRGTFGIYAEAYRRAAAQRGVLAREMQSITWEAVRGLFSPAFKRNYKRNAVAFDKIWEDYHAGQITLDEARNQLLQFSGGITPPPWAGRDSAGATQRWSSSYAGDLLAQSGMGGTAGAGARGNAADRVATLGPNKYQQKYLAGRQLQSLTADERAQYDILAGEGPQLKQTLADDFAAQTPFLEAKAREAGYKSIDEWAAADIAGFVKAAEEWRQANPAEALAQPARGTYDIASMTTVLNGNADLSTFLHETGHFFLDAIRRMVLTGAATPEVVEMYQGALKGLGVTPQEWEAWHDEYEQTGKISDGMRKAHEKWAETFEAYLFTGKAPSVQMRGLFRTFMSWLKRVYGSMQDFAARTGTTLDPDLKAVMDKMLATDQEIAEAEQVAGLLPDVDATAEAQEKMNARSMRDLKWARNAVNRYIAKLQKDANGMRKAIEDEVRAEVEAMPIYRALRWIKKGEITTEAGEEVKATKGHKINTEALAEMYPDSMLGRPDLAKLKGMTASTGLHPDLIAEMIPGWTGTGDQLVRALIDAEPMSSVIEGMTDQRMLERHGDLATPEAIAQAALEAVHNEARAKSLATELAGQREMVNARRDTGDKNAKGNRITVNVLMEAAKNFAANVIGRRKIGELKKATWAHVQAERRAAKAWEAATAKGDTQGAVQAKQDQMLNNAAAKAGIEAQAQVRKALELFKKVTRGTDEKLVERGYDPDIANAARAILAAYGIAPSKGKSAAEYLETLQRNDPMTYNAVAPSVNAALNNAKPFAELTFADLEALVDEIQSLWHLARRSRQMEVDGDLLDREDVQEDLKSDLEAKGIPSEMPGDTSAITPREQAIRKLLVFKSAATRVENWTQGMGAMFTKYVFQPVKEAADRYRAAKTDYLKKYRDLLKSIEPSLKREEIVAPELGYTFGRDTGGIAMQEILHAIGHTGNASNKKKLLLGRGWATELEDGTLDTSRWDAFVQRMIDEGRLTKAHYDFVQGVWDLLESMKPLAQKTHRDVFGRYFAEVTADGFVTPFGAYRGGYLPAIADSRIVSDAATRKLMEEENDSMTFAFPATNRGFTKGRVEYNRPLMLDLRTLAQHIDKVLLFSHMEQPIRDVRRVLTAKGVAYGLNRIDPAGFDNIVTPWLNRAARQQVEAPVPGDAGTMRFFSNVRNRAGLAAMFANFANAAQQITGFSIAAVKVKPSYLLSAAAQMMGSPQEMKQAVADASVYMKERMENESSNAERAIADILLKPSVYDNAKNWTTRHAYFAQQAIDNMMGPVIWTGAFNQATEQGLSEKDAVRFADSVIRTTQGSTLPEDVSRMEGGNAFVRIFTQFASYANMQANLLGHEFAKTARELGVKKGAGRMLYVAVLGGLVPMWVGEAIVQAFRGGPDDEDKDGEYLDDWIAAVFGFGTLRGLTAMIPGVGQVVNAGVNTFNSKPYDDRIGSSPAVSMIESAVSAPHSVYKAMVEDGNKQKAVRDVATLLTLTTGLPVAAAARPLGYLAGVSDYKINPTSGADMARGLVTGVASPQSK